jgi:hypothetical protein
LVIAAAYTGSLFHVNRDIRTAWGVVGARAFTAKGTHGLECGFAMAREGFTLDFEVAADFPSFEQTPTEPRPMTRWNTELLRLMREVSKAAANDFRAPVAKAAFERLGTRGFDAFDWATDHSEKQVKNKAYVLRGRPSSPSDVRRVNTKRN